MNVETNTLRINALIQTCKYIFLESNQMQIEVSLFQDIHVQHLNKKSGQNLYPSSSWVKNETVLTFSDHCDYPSLPHHYMCTAYSLDQCYKSSLLFYPEEDVIFS